ncbi:MAG: hypothetical protein ABIC57_02830 [bacterium]
MIISRVYAIGGDTADQLSDLDSIIIKIFGYIWPFVGVALFFVFISGGVMWLMSEGDPQRLQKAQATMLWAVVGAVVIAAIGLIMGLFTGLLDVSWDLVNPGNIF